MNRSLKKRRLQFGLRVSLIALVGIGVFFGWTTARVRKFQEKHRVALQLESLGATVEEVQQVPSWIRWMVGEDGCAGIVSVAFYEESVNPKALSLLREKTSVETLLLNHTNVNEHTVEEIGKLEHLKNLYLANTAITDFQVAKLSDLDNIEVLDLSNTKVTDQALHVLTRFPRLRIVALDNTVITDDGLTQLVECPNLEVLYIAATNVTEVGIAEFKSKRPSIQVVENPGDPVLFKD